MKFKHIPYGECTQIWHFPANCSTQTVLKKKLQNTKYDLTFAQATFYILFFPSTMLNSANNCTHNCPEVCSLIKFDTQWAPKHTRFLAMLWQVCKAVIFIPVFFCFVLIFGCGLVTDTGS